MAIVMTETIRVNRQAEDFLQTEFAQRPIPRCYRRRVIPVEAAAAAYAQWLTPALPLYGNDHERADFAP